MLQVMDDQSFDLNHARALHYLLEEAHVARAAKRLGITPAAASNALRRLRADFDDPLLVRMGRRLVRTPVAEKLREPAREVLAGARRLLEARRPFDPTEYEGDFVLTTSDRVAELFATELDRFLSQRAPRARLTLRAVTHEVARYLREHGGLAIIPSITREPDLAGEPLFTDEFCCVMRRRHPLLRGAWTPRRFASAEFIEVVPETTPERRALDQRLDTLGLSRRITRVVTSFGVALPFVLDSDRLLVVPRTFALRRARELPLAVRPVPLALPSIEMQVLWHPARAHDPRTLWLCALLHEAARRAALPGAT